MTHIEKKQIYNDVMQDVARLVKRRLNENLTPVSSENFMNFYEYAEESFHILADKLDSVSFLFSKNKPEERACYAIELTFNAKNDTFDENDFNNIFTMDLKGKNIELVGSDTDISIKKVLYKLYNDYEFVKQVVNDTKKIIKSYTTNNKLQDLKLLCNMENYERFYTKRYLSGSSEKVSQRNINRYGNIILSRNRDTLKIKTINEVVYLNPCTMALCMLMNAEHYL